jgi:hypothetical protein
MAEERSVRERFRRLAGLFSMLGGRERLGTGGEIGCRESIVGVRDWIGGSELLPAEILFKDGVLNA